MAQPFDFTLREITCFSTFDLTTDNVVARIGPVTRELGTFSTPGDGQSTVQNLNIVQVVPTGEHFLFIENHNTLAADDTLSVIDLSADDYTAERTVTIVKESAHYELAISATYPTTVLDPIE